MSDQSDFEEQYRQEVADLIRQDTSIFIRDLSVSGSGEKIELYGVADTYEARLAAEEHAWTFPGVTFVKNNISVEGQDEQPPDEEAELSIRDYLAERVDTGFEDVEVTFDAGTAMLEGIVDSSWKRQRLEDIITDIPIVIDYVLRIAVVPPGGTETDRAVAMSVVRNLDDNERVDINTLVVTVNDGVVILSGEVPSFETGSAAYDTALRTPGVVKVRDELTVQTEF